MSKKNETTDSNNAMQYDALLGAVKPLPKDNGSVEFWGKLNSLKDNEWHHIAIVVENGKRTNYVDGVKV